MDANLGEAASIIGTALVAVAGILGARRIYNKDTKDATNNAAERGLLVVLRQERDDAVKWGNAILEQSRAEAARCARIEAKNEYMAEQIVELHKQLLEVRQQLVEVRAEARQLRQQFRDSGFDPN